MEIVKINKRGGITIRVPLKLLRTATKFHPDLGGARITDAKLFAEEVFRQLCQEEEDGTTPVHKMFDAAILEAVEQGAEGIVLPDDDLEWDGTGFKD